jgi:hypothetical protein
VVTLFAAVSLLGSQGLVMLPFLLKLFYVIFQLVSIPFAFREGSLDLLSLSLSSDSFLLVLPHSFLHLLLLGQKLVIFLFQLADVTFVTP